MTTESVDMRPALLGGRYELGTRLGAGGMGIVYKARDTVLGRTVAVKVFRDGASAVERTSSETQLLAALNHPALVTLYDAHVGEVEPLYLVMEYVDGPTLQARLESGPLTPKSVARIARDLAEALHVVHEAGIIHRDIKPANVLLRSSRVPDEEFHAKLADFGIAYLVDSTRLTTPGTVIGSVAYLSPEQVTGSPPKPASDIYALGLLLLEALTGQRAFPQVASHEAALARLTQEPIIPSTVGAGWAALLSAMTARDPSRRPSALDVVVAVSRLNAVAATDPLVDADITVGADAPARNWTDESPTLVVPAEPPALPPAPPAPPASLTAHTTAHIAVMPAEQDSATATPRWRRWPRWLKWLIPLAVVAAIALMLVIPALGGPGEEPAPPPALPALEEPLTTHIEQLLDSVSP